jgi:hypothetical protein
MIPLSGLAMDEMVQLGLTKVNLEQALVGRSYVPDDCFSSLTYNISFPSM